MVKKDIKKKVEKLNWLDVQLIKLSVFFLAFFIASFIPFDFLEKYRWMWLILFVLFIIKPLYKALKK